MSQKRNYLFDITPRWLKHSGLPKYLNKNFGPYAWSIFHCLIQLDCRYNPDYPDTFDQTFEEIAELVGASINTISTHIKAFEENHFLIVKRGKFTGDKSTFRLANPIKTPKKIKEIPTKYGGLLNRKGEHPIPRYAESPQRLGAVKGEEPPAVGGSQKKEPPAAEKEPPAVGIQEEIRREKKKENNTSSPKLKFTDEDMKLVKKLENSIKEIDPNHRFAGGQRREKWANTFRLIREQDHRKIEDIRAVMETAFNDRFWCTVIQSADGFREHYNQLRAKMLGGKGNGKKEERSAPYH